MEPDRKKKLPDPPVPKEKRQPAPKPATSPRPDLAQAGGYEEQRALLKPQGDRAADVAGPAHGAGAALGVADEYAAERKSAAKFPRQATILTLEAAVMSRPQFVGARVAMLKRGEEVTLTGQEGSWYACIAPNGARGYIHKARVDKVDVQLRPGDTGTGNTRGEAEVAGRA